MSRHIEFIERRVLGAIRIVDAAGRRPIARALRVFSDTLRFTRNRSGLHVITGARVPTDAAITRQMDEYTANFDETALPVVAQRNFTAWVEDPAGAYMAREFTIALPRTLDRSAASSVFAIEEIEMLPAVTARTGSSDAIIRVVALHNGTRAVFPEILVRAVAAGGPIGWGMSDANGEALVSVPGLPLFHENGGTLTRGTSLTLSFIAFPALPPPPPGGPPPYPPRGSLSTVKNPLPGNHRNWRLIADGAAPDIRSVLLHSLNGVVIPQGGPPRVAVPSLAVSATPGGETRVAVLVEP